MVGVVLHFGMHAFCHPLSLYINLQTLIVNTTLSMYSTPLLNQFKPIRFIAINMINMMFLIISRPVVVDGLPVVGLYEMTI